MKNLNKLLLLLGVASMLFGACTPTYLPNSVNTPLLGNKGEVAGNIQGTLNGWNAQVAVGATNHIGVMAAGQFKGGKISGSINDSTGTPVVREENFRHYFVEGGAGWFGRIGNRFRYAAWLGAGYGQTKTLDFFIPNIVANGEIDYIRGQFVRGFVMPEIGYKSKIFDASFTPRISYVHFVNTERLDDGLKSPDNFRNLFVEPVLTTRVGYNWVKLTSSIGASVPVMKLDPGEAFNLQPFIWTIGIQFNIGGFKHM